MGKDRCVHVHSSGYHRQDELLLPEEERQHVLDEFHLEEDKLAFWDEEGCPQIIRMLEQPVEIPKLPASIPYEV